MPSLRILKGNAAQKEYPLDAERFSIGRERSRDLVLDRNDVSRRHAEIVREDERFYLVDLDSRNHTYVNNRRLEPNTRYLLKHDDLIRICNFILVFVSNELTSWKESAGEGLRETVDVIDDGTDDEDSGISNGLAVGSSNWEDRAALNAETKLRAIMRIIADLHGAFTLDQVLDQVLGNLLDLFPGADCAIVVFREEHGKRIFPSVVRIRESVTLERVTVSRTIVEHVLSTQRALLLPDLGGIVPDWTNVDSVHVGGLKSLMCAPVLDLDGRSLGVVQLDARLQTARFTEDDLDVLSLVVSLLTFAIEEARLQSAARDQRAWQREVEVAREIQLNLLPGESPKHEHYEFYDYYAPAKEVGGDYYDYLELPDNRLAIVMGDVSGKGVPAALLMAKLSSELRVYLASGLSAVEVLQRTNQSYSERTPEGSLVTLVLVILDRNKHEVEIANAGHQRPLLIRGDEPPKELACEETGVPLGVLPDLKCRPCHVALQPGDCLLLYTDGVTDATNVLEAMYELDGLLAQLSRVRGSATETGQSIIHDVQQFVGNEPQMDDMCLVCISRRD
jgi:sigma-B regulation protein RsbU (phosphoserine phosphatase)